MLFLIKYTKLAIQNQYIPQLKENIWILEVIGTC